MPKHGKMKDIKVKEISLVDLPANKLPFLFYKRKGHTMNEKVLKSLQTYLGVEDIDFEKKVDNAEIEKALNLISEHYKADFPEDLENAVGVLAKIAVNSCKEDDSEDIEKVGAKFSKDVIAKLKAVVEAVDALKSILPDVKEETKKSDGGGETSELEKQIAELKESVAKLGTGKESDDKSSIAELTKTLKDVSGRLATIESGGAVKKSIEDQDNDGDENVQKGAGEDGKKLWPTITGQAKPK